MPNRKSRTMAAVQFSDHRRLLHALTEESTLNVVREAAERRSRDDKREEEAVRPTKDQMDLIITL